MSLHRVEPRNTSSLVQAVESRNMLSDATEAELFYFSYDAADSGMMENRQA